MSEHIEEVALTTLDLCRAFVFAHLPWYASVEYAEDWLITCLPSALPQLIIALLSLHVNDNVITEWRSDFVNMVRITYHSC